MRHSRPATIVLPLLLPLLIPLLLGAAVLSVGATEARAQLTCLGEAEARVRSARSGVPDVDLAARPMSLGSMIALLLVQHRETVQDSARADCVAAELMKRAGDTRAPQFYRRAIARDSTNPEYHWLFGDYLRNYRGPRQPLVVQARREYLAAFRMIPEDRRSCRQTTLVCLVERSLIALYERDGLALTRSILTGDPIVFLAVQVSSGETLPGESEDDVRALTAEAAFAASSARLNRPLSLAERRALVRRRPDSRASGRLRLRYRLLPLLEVSAAARRLRDAQTTRFAEPGVFNDVTVGSTGVALEAPLDLYPFADILIRGEHRWVRRQGLIEFLPDATEDARSSIGQLVLSRFVGPDKLNLELTISEDAIDQRIATPVTRRLRIAAPTLRYELYRGTPFERRIAVRNSELYVGSTVSTETFGATTVRRTDYFGGVVLRALPGLGGGQSFDLTVQPTRYGSEQRGVDAVGRPVERLRNAQLRMNGALAYRLVDRENRMDVRELPPLVFLHLVLTGARDRALTGPGDFVSSKGGAGLAAKLVNRRLNGGTSFLVSAKYEVHHFARLDRDEGLFHVSLGMGF